MKGVDVDPLRFACESILDWGSETPPSESDLLRRLGQVPYMDLLVDEPSPVPERGSDSDQEYTGLHLSHPK